MQYLQVVSALQKFTNKINISQAEIGRIIGVSRSAMNGRVQRNSSFTDAEIDKINDFYKVDVRNYMDLDKDNVNIIKIQASCGSGVINTDIDYLQLDHKQKYIYCFANGDSMRETIFEGDLLIVKVQDFIDKQNDIYCFTYANEQYIKRLSKNLNQLVISSDNKKYADIVLKEQEMDSIRIIGRLVGTIRKI